MKQRSQPRVPKERAFQAGEQQMQRLEFFKGRPGVGRDQGPKEKEAGEEGRKEETRSC